MANSIQKTPSYKPPEEIAAERELEEAMRRHTMTQTSTRLDVASETDKRRVDPTHTTAMPIRHEQQPQDPAAVRDTNPSATPWAGIQMVTDRFLRELREERGRAIAELQQKDHETRLQREQQDLDDVERKKEE